MKQLLLLMCVLFMAGAIEAQTIIPARHATQSTKGEAIPIMQLGQTNSNLTSIRSTQSQSNELIRCYTVENEAARRAKNPSLPSPQDFERWIQTKIQEQKPKTSSSRLAATILKIPVVVHVVHNGEEVGKGANITAAQVYSQLESLNEDFRRLNADKVNTRTIFEPVAADLEIEFVPATVDPAGNQLAEPGIRRYNGQRASWDTRADIEDILKPATIWDPTRYSNMWTLQTGGDMANILGYAQFPESSGLDGMPTTTQNSNTDGTVMGYAYFGSSAKDPGGIFNLRAPYDLGRTTTHEMGHWLGLRHIWGDGNCSVDDYVTDTPTATAANSVCDPTIDSCKDGAGDLPDMIENYMDYTGDGCMNIFTAGQKSRTQAVMLNSPRRKELPASVVDSLTYHDAGISLINYSTDCDGNLTGTALLTNYATAASLNSVTVNIEIDGALQSTQTWSLSLASLRSTIISLPQTTLAVGTHSIRVYTTNPNSTSDQNTLNDARTKSITRSVLSGNYAQNFETGSSSLQELIIIKNTESNYGVAADAANNSSYGLYLEGNSAKGYPEAPAFPAEAEAFDPAHSHYAAAVVCYDATTASSASLSFDYYLNYGVQNGYTNFRYKIVSDKGNFTSPVYQPDGADKPWTNVTLDLSPYVGGKIQIYFESNCKYTHNSDLNGVAGEGNGVYIENIAISYTTAEPEISFAAASGAINEANATNTDGCRTYTDYVVNLDIANAPTMDATVLVSVTGGTANNISDYSLLTTSVVFPAGSTTSQAVNIRTYDDHMVESAESITLGLQLSGTTDAILSSGEATHTLTIDDNDSPLVAGTTHTIFTESFENGSTNWNTVYFTAAGSEPYLHNTQTKNNWFSGNMWTVTGMGNAAYVTEAFNKTSYDNSRNTNLAFVSPLIDAANLKDLKVGFYYGVQGEANKDYGRLAYALEGSNTYYVIDGPYQGTGTNAYWKEVTLPAALEGQRFHLAWNWVNDNNGIGTASALVIDEIQVTGYRELIPIATELNAQQSYYLGPYATVHFFDKTSGKIIASVENTSGWDYGCTSIVIDRNGTSSKEFWNVGIDRGLTDKTVYITPSNNNTSGTYNITLYYTEEEIAGWELLTGKSRKLLQMAKISGAHVYEVTPSSFPVGATGYLSTSNTLSTFGKGTALTGTFASGFSGFGAGDPGEPPTNTLPVTLLYFSGTAEGADANLSWSTITEENAAYFEVEHSEDGRNFRSVGKVAAAGNTLEQKYYSFTHTLAKVNMQYYRLRMVDVDESFEYSKVIHVQQAGPQFAVLGIHPNPAHYNATINLSANKRGTISLSLQSANGIPLSTTQYNVVEGYNKLPLDLNKLPAGLYILQFNNAGQKLQRKLIVY